MESKWEYFSNEVCKKGKKMKRNVKHYYKNNKMIQFVFDEYIYSFSFNVNTKDLKQKHDEINITTVVPNTNCHQNAEETITFQNNKRNKVMHTSNSKKKKKKKKKYKNKNKSKKNRKKSKSKPIINNESLHNEVDGTDHIIVCELSDGEEKSLSTTDFEMESMSASVPMTPTDSFECEFCGYVNTLSASHCEQCSNSLYDQTGHPDADNDNDNKLFREVQKKSKKKRNQKSNKKRKYQRHNQQKIAKSSKQFKQRVNPNKKLNKCTKKINPKRRPPLKQIQRKNNLNPNAKEFVLPKQASTESLESIPSPCDMETHYSNPTLPSQIYHHHTEYPTEYPTHSPSHSHSHPRRLSKIPRLQRSVNPEFDFPPRHRRHHHNKNQHRNDHSNNNAYHSNPETHSHSNHHHGIPPRFQSPQYRNSSISPMASKDHYDHLYDDEFHDSEMDAQSVLSGTTFDASLLDSRNRPSFTTELDPPPPLMNLPLILPVVPPQPPLPPPLPLGSCIDSALSTMPAADTEDLQKQLSDMEKNVHQQLKVLDSLFPEYKPDLTQDIQNMQESMKDMVCFE